MKKTLYLAAILALTACSNDEVIGDSSTDKAEIKLQVTTAVASRAPELHGGAAPSINDFQMWGIVDETVDSDGQLPIYTFINEKVSRVDEKFTFENKQYWPDDEINLKFFSFHHNSTLDSYTTAPTINSVYGSSASQRYYQMMVTNYVVPENANNQDDVLYAVSDYENKSEHDGVLPINFRHALAQLQFQIYNVSDNFYLEVKDIEVINVKNKGTFTCHISTDNNYTLDGGMNFPTGYCEWALTADTISHIYKYPTDGSDYRVVLPKCLTTNGVTKNITNNPTEVPTLLVMPQNSTVENTSLNGTAKFADGIWLRLSCRIYDVTADMFSSISSGSADEFHQFIAGEEASSSILHYGTHNYDDGTDDFKYLYLRINPITEDSIDGWQAGKKYIYKLTLGGDVSNGLNDEGDEIFTPINLLVDVKEWIENGGIQIDA
jgi:hypothetical protein